MLFICYYSQYDIHATTKQCYILYMWLWIVHVLYSLPSWSYLWHDFKYHLITPPLYINKLSDIPYQCSYASIDEKNTYKKNQNDSWRGLRDCSGIKNTYNSPRRPEWSSQHPCQKAGNTSVILVSGFLKLLSSMGTCTHVHIPKHRHTCVHN